jgi:DnaJ-class molecular chaperone
MEIDPRLVTDVLKLVQSVDIKKLISSVQGGDGDLDSMVSSLTRSMLAGGAGAAEQELTHTVNLSLHQAQLGKNKKVRVRRLKAGVKEQRELVVEIPAGVCDGHEIRIAGEGNERPESGFGDLVVRVSVAQVHGAFFADGAALYTRVPLTLSETRRLSLRVAVPGNREEVLAHDDDAPLSGWRVVRGRGLVRDGKPQGDLFVLFDVRLPASWAGVTTLQEIPAVHDVDAAPATGALDVPTGEELAACARAGAHVAA